jgi:predicted phage terminase large subunit-like protein
LEGSWTAKEEAAGYFKREWCKVIELADVPMATRRVRAWDKAATLPSSAYPDPDWTVGIKGTLDSEGNLYVIDMQRFRDRPAVVQERIEDAALKDGKGCIVGIPQDVGGAAVEAAMYSSRLLRQKGCTVKINKANKSKEIRFQPVAILAQNRQVYVVKGDWNEAFFKELEAFGSGRGHDDIVDALSDLYRMLINKTINIPTILVNPTKDINGNSLL